MRHLAQCLICASKTHRLLYSSTYSGGVAEAAHYFLAQRRASAHGDIRKCEQWGFVFTSPQFDISDYDFIYSTIGAEVVDGPNAGGAGEQATERRFRRLYDVISGLSDFRSPFLDFGCGDGAFLRVTGNANGTGFEIGSRGRRTGPNGSTIYCGNWPDLAGSAIPWESQSFVTAFDVFEHLPNLDRDVDLIRRVIRPGGHLHVTVPDIGSTMAQIARGRWNMLLLEHLWYFNAETLDRFLNARGFTALAHHAVPYDASAEHVLSGPQNLSASLHLLCRDGLEAW